MIRAALIHAVNANDADLLERVAPTDSERLYADKAYDTKASQAWLQEHGIASQIVKKGAHQIKPTEHDRAENRSKRWVRGGIERIFAHWKQWQHCRRVRYLGLAKNQLELTLKAVAYNLERLANILERQSAWKMPR